MRYKKTTDWVTILPQIVMGINKTYSSFLGMTPLEANDPNNDPLIRQKWERKIENYSSRKTQSSYSWKVGDFLFKKLKDSPLYKGYVFLSLIEH